MFFYLIIRCSKYCSWNSVKDGFGKFTYFNGDVYEGMFKNDKRNGWGVYRTKEGTKYEGEWKDMK